jgi:glycosyltransferase involved in cell wall biosynthesis
MNRTGSGTRLFVDLQVTQSTDYGERGMPRYAAEFANALLEAGAPIAAFALNPSLPPPPRLPTAVRDSGLVVWNTIDVFRRLSEPGPLMPVLTCPFFEQHPVESVLPRHLLVGSGPIAAVLYDLIPYVMPDRYQRTAAERKLYGIRQQLVRRAEVLLALSENTRRDAIEILGVPPERVHTIGAGASEFFRTPTEDEDPAGVVHAALPDVRRRFLLAVGGPDPRKNWPALIEAFSLLPNPLRASLQLVLVSNLASQESLRARARECGLRDDELVIAPLVSDEVLRALYQSAGLFVLPSLYEGFGLPVLEAARCGCVALTSNVSSLPEVLDYEPATFAPDDPAAMASVMQRALEDDAFRGELQRVGKRAAQQHTWAAVADQTVTALRGVAKTRQVRPLRRRIAIVGRSSPESGIIAGTRPAVLHALAASVDVDCFEAGVDARVLNHSSRRWRAFPIETLGSTFVPASYDAVIYMIDEPALGGPVTRRFLRFPGIAYLRADPSRAADIVWNARAVLLPSDFARQITNSIVADGVAATREVLPLPAPTVVEHDRPSAGAFRIVVPGAIRSHDQAASIIEAVALLRPTARARVAFLGASDPHTRRTLMRLARNAGGARDVLFTDFVIAHEYETRLATASCAVCLTPGWSGGGSFPVLDALAAGVPVISDRADAAELPTAGVVPLASGAGPPELAAALRRLLDPADRRERGNGAHQYAATWTAEAYAEGLLDAISRQRDEPCDLITTAT